jgi:hypothetical protein
MRPNATAPELNLAAERVGALGRLSAMFGEGNADGGGAENVDSDVLF